MKDSKLSQKLLGILPKPSMEIDDAKNSKHRPTMGTIRTGMTTPISAYVSPMSVVETFLEKFTYASDSDGQISPRTERKSWNFVF
jgi:hypothetical protein